MKISLRLIGIYLLVFLFGWSCAVFSYSDVIYSQPEISVKPEVVKTVLTPTKKLSMKMTDVIVLRIVVMTTTPVVKLIYQTESNDSIKVVET